MNITKRDGHTEKFDITKISKAMRKAFNSVERETNDVMLEMLALRTVAKAQEIVKELSVEVIQDCAEAVLMECGFSDVAKSYVLYRQKRANIRNMTLDVEKVVEEYIGQLDWRVKENSTVSYSLGGFILSNSGAITSNYWLNHFYDEEIANAHRNCDMHIHDLSMLSGYCAGWSLKQLILEGLGGVENRITSKPAKHLHTLCNQMVNFLGIMQNEWAGAQAFSSFDTYLSAFVKADNLDYHSVKQCIQSFVFGVNTPSRWGCQAPFSNITLDWTCPEDLKDMPAIVGGQPQDFTYGDCDKERAMVNKVFLEVMIEGDANGRGHQYPIPTYSITKDFDWSESENLKLLFDMTAKYGTPYFSNYVNSDMNPSDIRSMCCRLRLDLTELRRKNGGFFGSGESTGSVGVVTINLPKLAYESENVEEFYKKLDHIMDVAARSLDIKRKVVTKLMDSGFFPYTKRYLGHFDNHFSTLGLVGMNEAGLNAKWIQAGMDDKRTQDWAEEILNHMRNRLVKYQQEYGALFNLESTPAESTSYRFAKHDKKRYPDIKSANDNGTPYYTNSTNLPVGYTADVFDALDIQDRLQVLYTSGTVFHTFLGEKLPDWKAAANLVKTISDNYRLPYYTLSPTYSICKNHGYLVGEHETCPECGEVCEVYSRITGYYRPIKNWNDGKAQEFEDRKEYVIKEKTSIDKFVDAVGHVGETVKEKMVEISDTIKESFCASCGISQDEDVMEDTNEVDKGMILLTTPVCPNCKIVKAFLESHKQFVVKEMDATEGEGKSLSKKLRVLQAPTLVVYENDDTKVISGAPAILAYFRSL